MKKIVCIILMVTSSLCFSGERMPPDQKIAFCSMFADFSNRIQAGRIVSLWSSSQAAKTAIMQNLKDFHDAKNLEYTEEREMTLDSVVSTAALFVFSNYKKTESFDSDSALSGCLKSGI